MKGIHKIKGLVLFSFGFNGLNLLNSKGITFVVTDQLMLLLTRGVLLLPSFVILHICVLENEELY